ncbi:MAG: penicillin-binding protein [Bacteroidetes bacterium]|nr:penicillin-binding protein [Bacteroidota bacterium]
MELKEFLKSKLFLKHLGLIVLTFLVLLFIIFQLLNIYTRHGKEYVIPAIEGLQIEEVQEMTEMSPFEIIVIDSIFTPGEPSGKILTQDPKPESKAKRGRKIYVIITANSGEKIGMPDCTDQSVRSAVNEIINSGLRIGRLIFNQGEFSNLVVEQIYKGKPIFEGTKIAKGEEVDLVVEINQANTATTMPNIIGLTEIDAERKLWEASLNVGSKNYEGNKDVVHSRVVSFSPSNRSLTVGSTVSLYFINDTKPNYSSKVKSFKITENTEEETPTTTDIDE